ncbi:MAG: hypothetical protein AAFZ18_10480 [Myxococcota bacterium]
MTISRLIVCCCIAVSFGQPVDAAPEPVETFAEVPLSEFGDFFEYSYSPHYGGDLFLTLKLTFLTSRRSSKCLIASDYIVERMLDEGSEPELGGRFVTGFVPLETSLQQGLEVFGMGEKVVVRLRYSSKGCAVASGQPHGAKGEVKFVFHDMQKTFAKAPSNVKLER